MAIAVSFDPPGHPRGHRPGHPPGHPPGWNLEQFDLVDRRIHDAVGGQPKGTLHSSGFGDDGNLMIDDIWESQEDFEAFGKVLTPVLGQLGIDAGAPDVMPLDRLSQKERH